jgi:hypothetical protein
VPCPITNSIVALARNPLLRSCGWLTTRKGTSYARTAVAGKSNNAGQRSLSSRLGRAREASLTGVTTITPKHMGDIASDRGPEQVLEDSSLCEQDPAPSNLWLGSAPGYAIEVRLPLLQTNHANRKL